MSIDYLKTGQKDGSAGKGTCHKADSLSSIPKTYTVGGENSLLHVCVRVHIHNTHIQINAYKDYFRKANVNIIWFIFIFFLSHF